MIKYLKNLLIFAVIILGFTMVSATNVQAASLKASLKTDCGSTATTNDTIKLTASSSGGKGTKKYKFRYKYKGKMYTIKGYSKTKKVSYKLKKNGTYKFYVYVKAKNKVVKKTKSVTVAKYSVSLKNTGNYINKKVTLTAGSTGGFKSKSYQFSYTLDDKSTVIKKYSSSKTASFTPKDVGTYVFQVTCKDAKGRTIQTTKTINILETYTSTDMEARQKVVNIAKGWLGVKEGSAKHKEIIKIYNSEKNNMYYNGKYKHYTAKTSDSWCDIFVSACFIKAGYKVISGVECGCERHVELLNKKLCSWVEDDAYVPTTGDIIFYDWDDNGKGDCKGHSDHVGIVCEVNGNNIKVIEGNKNDKVAYRTIKVNGRYIRGYGVPKYEDL